MPAHGNGLLAGHMIAEAGTVKLPSIDGGGVGLPNVEGAASRAGVHWASRFAK